MKNQYLDRIRILEKKHNFLIKKRLGQNFLIDDKVMDAMIGVANLKKDDFVLEIGPGLGFLTEKILSLAGKIIAVEKDPQLYQTLTQDFKNQKIKFINGDIFSINLEKHRLKDLKYKIVSNIPYYLTSRLIRYFMENSIRPSVMAILVQKEVADRVIAEAGSHSLLSLSVQFYGKAEKIMDVGSAAFSPAPEISSAILKITLYQKPVFEDVDIKLFFMMLKIAFASRRKQLHNNLAAGLRISSAEVKEIFKGIGIDPLARAQDLNLDNWRGIYTNLRQKKLFKSL